MDELECKSIEELFPQFSSAEKSRFIQMFEELSTKSKICNEKAKTYDVRINSIISGEERRTSLIIKGFPSKMLIQEVYYLLKYFTQDITFFYIPIYIKEKKKYMYAFVNVFNYKSVIPLYIGLTNLKNKKKFYCGYDFSELEICFSKTQGQNALAKKCYGTE